MWNQSFDAVFGHMFLSFGCGIVVWNCNKTKLAFLDSPGPCCSQRWPWRLESQREKADGIWWNLMEWDGLWMDSSMESFTWIPNHSLDFGSGNFRFSDLCRIWDCEPSSSFLKVPRVISTQVSELVGVMSGGFFQWWAKLPRVELHILHVCWMHVRY